MTPRRHILTAAALGLLAAPARAQQGRAVTIIVPFAPGGSTDIGARLIAPRLAAHLDQTVVVENRAGAGGATAAEYARRLPPDGQSLLLGVAATQAVNPALFADLPYDPERDFAAVALLGVTGFVLVVAAGSGITDVQGLIARLKAEPGKHNFAPASGRCRISPANGSRRVPACRSSTSPIGAAARPCRPCSRAR